MAEFVCEYCSKGFSRNRAGKRVIRFCSQNCYHSYRKDNNIITGQFTKGLTPWNKNQKGIHLSPNSEFKKGQIPVNYLPVGSVQIRERTTKDKHKRAFVKVAEPNHWRLRCHVVWERHYGPIPKGLVIHHIDKNPLNDEISNLAAVSRTAHINYHREDLHDNARARVGAEQERMV